MTNAGRNEPCPCGSGRKYKHCCLNHGRDAERSGGDLAWRRIRRAADGLIGKLLTFFRETYGEQAIEEAWDAFTLWPEEPSWPVWHECSQRPIFLAWLLHRWSPDPDDTVVNDFSLHGLPPTQAYLARRGRHLDPVARRFLEACLAAPLAFHEIISVQPGRGFRARELIFGTERDVIEQSASQSLQRGQLLFGSLVDIDGIVVLEACAPFPLPPQDKLWLMQMRGRIRQGGELFPEVQLGEWEIELRDAYLAAAWRIEHPSLPELRNTEGDHLSLQRLVYDVESAQAAFDALKHLALAASDEDLLTDSKRDAEGLLRWVRLAWLKSGRQANADDPRTVMGDIEIDDRRLYVTVNSNQRAGRFKRIIRRALGTSATLRATELQSVQGAMNDGLSGNSLPPVPSQVRADPEAQALLQQFLRRHYEDWVTQPLPALEGKTPLQAVLSSDGRERVAALLAQFELNGQRMQTPMDASILESLRSRLGFAK